MKKLIKVIVVGAVICAIDSGSSAISQTWDAFIDFTNNFYLNPSKPINMDATHSGGFHQWGYGMLTNLNSDSFNAFDSSRKGSFWDGVDGSELWYFSNGNLRLRTQATAQVNIGSNPDQRTVINGPVVVPFNQIDLDGEKLIGDVRWKAPVRGDYQITGSVQRNDRSGNLGADNWHAVSVKIIKNIRNSGGEPMFSINLPAADINATTDQIISHPIIDQKSQGILVVRNMAAGDTLDFTEKPAESNFKERDRNSDYNTIGFSITIKSLTPPDPVLVLCADKLVTDGFCNKVDQSGQPVGRWGNMIPNQYHGAQQPDLLKQPHLFVDSSPSASTKGRSWIRFDGANTFLTTFFGDRASPMVVNYQTVFVVMRLANGDQITADPTFPAKLSSSPSTFPELQAYQALLNPHMTIIGNQSYSIFQEFGLSRGIPDYRFVTDATPLPADPKDTKGYVVNQALAAPTLDTPNVNCSGNQVHVLAARQKYDGNNCIVTIFIDGKTVFNGTQPQAQVPSFPHGMGMSCIGGGYYYAATETQMRFPNCNCDNPANFGNPDCNVYHPLKGLEMPNNFAYAANLFSGEISAVVAYDQELDDSMIKTVTDSFLTPSNPNNFDGLWGQ